MQTSLRRSQLRAHVYRVPASVPSGDRSAPRRCRVAPDGANCPLGVTSSDEPVRRGHPRDRLFHRDPRGPRSRTRKSTSGADRALTTSAAVASATPTRSTHGVPHVAGTPGSSKCWTSSLTRACTAKISATSSGRRERARRGTSGTAKTSTWTTLSVQRHRPVDGDDRPVEDGQVHDDRRRRPSRPDHRCRASSPCPPPVSPAMSPAVSAGLRDRPDVGLTG